jgi:hypothetical protein
MHRTVFIGLSAHFFVFEIIQKLRGKLWWFWCRFKAGNRSNPTPPRSWHISLWLLRYLIKCEKCRFFRIFVRKSTFFTFYQISHQPYRDMPWSWCRWIATIASFKMTQKSSEFATSILNYFKNKKMCAQSYKNRAVHSVLLPFKVAC